MQISPINSTNSAIYSSKTGNSNQTSFKMNIQESLKFIERTAQEAQYKALSIGLKMPKRADYFKMLREQMPTMEEFKKMVDKYISCDENKQRWLSLYKKAPCRTLAFFNMKDSFGKFYRDCRIPNIEEDEHFNMPDLVEAMANAKNEEGKRIYNYSFSSIIDHILED